MAFSSSLHPAWTSIAGPVTGPLVLADHARGTAATMNGIGAVTIIEKRSFSQPRPRGEYHGSLWMFVRPHERISLMAQSAARDAFGDQVSRGP